MNEQLRRAPSPDLLPRFAAIVGDRYAITDSVALEPYLHEGRGIFHGRTSMRLARVVTTVAVSSSSPLGPVHVSQRPAKASGSPDFART